MDDDIIDALADVFAKMLDRELLENQRHIILAAMTETAWVINDYEKTYDLRYFYRRAGHPEPYPIHEMR